MTPKRFRALKHLTAALFALAMVSIFVLGIDGVIRGVHELTRIFATPATGPEIEPSPTPGIVPAFIVPPDGASTGASRSSGPD